MKILYAIQGTGNGHVCRAREIVPLLKRHGEVDVLISGIQSDVGLPFETKYVFGGLSYIFGKKGGIDLIATYRKSRIRQLLKNIEQLPVHDYDVVISDFEPVSAWACYLKNKPCVGLSHQAAVMNKNAPRPKKQDAIGRSIMKVYAPASVDYGFHFERFAENIFTPVIRKQVREANIIDDGHYTVYLPSYSDKKIVKMLGRFEEIKWHIFSKHFELGDNSGNIQAYPLDNNAFIRSMAASHGVLCGAGFETPAEALFLGKKLLVVPMKNQYEQHCNAAALKSMGVGVIKSLKAKYVDAIRHWLDNEDKIEVHYPDETDMIIQKILDTHSLESDMHPQPDDYKIKEFKKATFGKIISKIAGR